MILTLRSCDSLCASSKIFTLNPRTTPTYLSFSLTADAAITSLLVIGPISARWIAMFSLLRRSVTASIDPIVSHFSITPLELVSMKALLISESTIDLIFSSLSPLLNTYNGLPASTPSRSGAVIFTPAAAMTSVTGLNLSLGSRISSSGFGRSKDLILVTMAESLFANTILSPCLNTPSRIIVFAVGPKPTSSLISRIIPLAAPSCLSNLAAIYCCARPTKTASNSGIPTPVTALTGTIASSRAKSFTRQNTSEL